MSSFMNADEFSDVITTPPKLNITDPLNPDTTAQERLEEQRKQENARRKRENCCDDSCYCCIVDSHPSTIDNTNSDCFQILCCLDYWSETCGNCVKCCCCCESDNGCCGDAGCCDDVGCCGDGDCCNDAGCCDGADCGDCCTGCDCDCNF